MDPVTVSDEPSDTPPKKAMPVGRPFKPGECGNPGGQPKGAKRRARETVKDRSYTAKNGETYTGTVAMIHVLWDIATNEKEKARDRTGAAVAVLDRLEGKPTQKIETVEPERVEIDMSTLTDDQLALLESLPLTLADDDDADGNATAH
jgi:hypothetical protein